MRLLILAGAAALLLLPAAAKARDSALQAGTTEYSAQKKPVKQKMAKKTAKKKKVKVEYMRAAPMK